MGGFFSMTKSEIKKRAGFHSYYLFSRRCFETSVDNVLNGHFPTRVLPLNRSNPPNHLSRIK